MFIEKLMNWLEAEVEIAAIADNIKKAATTIAVIPPIYKNGLVFCQVGIVI